MVFARTGEPEVVAGVGRGEEGGAGCGGVVGGMSDESPGILGRSGRKLRSTVVLVTMIEERTEPRERDASPRYHD